MENQSPDYQKERMAQHPEMEALKLLLGMMEAYCALVESLEEGNMRL